ALEGQDGGPLRHTRLLLRVSESVHGRVGPPLPARLARRLGASLPCRAYAPRALLRERARSPARRDLAGWGGVSAFPRRGVDARALPKLRPARHRFRRLPLSGFPLDGRRRGNRPGLLALSPPCRGRRRARRG